MTTHRRLFAALALAAACTGLCAGTARAQQPAWTVMVYMSGDNNLERYIVDDLELELAATGSTAQVNVLALADRTPGHDRRRGDWRSTKLYYVTAGMHADARSAVADWGERDFGDPQTLADFVTWSKTNFPADHYALYFWGHGWSWHPGWVMEDDTNQDTLDADEVKAVQPTLGFLDVVAYDGCNMASLEVETLWHGWATAVAHSQEWVGVKGIEYDVILAALAANPQMSADDLAILSSQSAAHENTFSAVAVDGRFDRLLLAVDDFSKELAGTLAGRRAEYRAAFQATQSFWAAPMDKDLRDMAFQIERGTTDPRVRRSCAEVMAAVDSVVLEQHHKAGYRRAHGITIYHPSNAREKLDFDYYKTLDVAQLTHWDEFLDLYLR